MDFVLDASVSLAWFLPDEENAYADFVLDLLLESSAFVPSIWPVEFANAMAVAQRRGPLSGAAALACLDRVRSLPIVIDTEGASRAMEVVHSLSLSLGIAAYLELAVRRGVPLASLDEALKRAARDIGVPLFPAAAS